MITKQFETLEAEDGKMRRRAVSVLLAGVMTLGLAAAGLTGCGSAGEGKESIRLMVWSPQNDQSKDNGEWLQTMCEAFATNIPDGILHLCMGSLMRPELPVQFHRMLRQAQMYLCTQMIH